MIEGGVEKHCESLYPKLNDDIDITVYRRKPYVQSNGDYKHISFIDLPSTKIKGFEPFFHSFISSVIVLLKKSDLVHYHNIGPALFSPIVKIRKIPLVMFIVQTMNMTSGIGLKKHYSNFLKKSH